MPIVFVHGVNNRQGSEYAARVTLIGEFLSKYIASIAVNGKSVAASPALFPYWGDLGAHFSWDMQSLPPPGAQPNALGSGVIDPEQQTLAITLVSALADASTGSKAPLLATAKSDFPQAVELLSQALLLYAVRGNVPANELVHVASYCQALWEYAKQQPKPAWLQNNLTTDAQFYSQLTFELKEAQPQVQALGVADAITKAVSAAGNQLATAAKAVADKVVNTVGRAASTAVLDWSRPTLNGVMGRFFGDIFVYLDERGTLAAPGSIIQTICADIDKARKADPNELFVLIGHSLGGVIAYDILTHYRPDLMVDVFVSIGSQVSHFEELKLFRSSDRKIKSPSHVLPPANIKKWINIYDPVDIFSYRCEPVFERVMDFAYDTKTYVIKAHGAYFDQVRFYEHLASRVQGALT